VTPLLKKTRRHCWHGQFSLSFESFLHVESGRTGRCQLADRVSVRQQFTTVFPVSVSEETLDWNSNTARFVGHADGCWRAPSHFTRNVGFVGSIWLCWPHDIVAATSDWIWSNRRRSEVDRFVSDGTDTANRLQRWIIQHLACTLRRTARQRAGTVAIRAVHRWVIPRCSSSRTASTHVRQRLPSLP